MTDRDDVVGRWSAVEYEGKPIPADAIREIHIIRLEDDGVSILYEDGVNSTDVQRELDDDGSLHGDIEATTLIGCNGPDGTYETCPLVHPSGFGAPDAEELRLTDDGDLLLVADDSLLAVYEPAGPVRLAG